MNQRAIRKPLLPPVTIFALLEALVAAQTSTPSAENPATLNSTMNHSSPAVSEVRGYFSFF